jgi:nitrate reductase gamma subunit
MARKKRRRGSRNDMFLLALTAIILLAGYAIAVTVAENHFAADPFDLEVTWHVWLGTAIALVLVWYRRARR